MESFQTTIFKGVLNYAWYNLLTVRTFTVLFIGRCITKEEWVAALLGSHISIQVHEKVKFSGRDISFLAVKELKKENI